MSVAGETRRYELTLPSVRAGSVTSALLLTAICVLPVLLYLPFLMEPFMRDEGLYASVAQLVLDGGVPYRDAFDNKPPLIFGWFSFSFLIFGETVWAPRLMAALCLSATALLVYVQGRLVFSHAGGLIAGFAFALSVGIADFQTNANTEYFLVLPMTGALVAFTMGRRTGRMHWFLLSGVLSGLAIMTKQVAGFNFAALVAIVVIAAVAADGRRALLSAGVVRPVAVMTGGLVAALAVIAAPFVVAGAGGDLFEAIVVYAFGYSGGSSWAAKLDAAVWAPVYLLGTAGPWLLLAGLGAWWVKREGKGADHWVLILWLGGSALGASATGRFYDHYFVQMLPGLALLAPAACYLLKDRWSFRWARVTALWLLPLSAALPVLVTVAIYAQPNPEARHDVKYGSGLGALQITSRPLADYVASLTEPDDTIYNLGFQSEVYFYADRRWPTRYLFDHPFAVSRSYEEAALADLQANPPAVVIDSAVHEPETTKVENYYPELVAEWVKENYQYIGRHYYADLYVLKEPGGG